MPIYEYRCHACRRRVSIFFRSFSTVAEPTCPTCGGTELTRVVSRVNVLRSSPTTPDTDEVGPDPSAMFGDIDENDPRAVARWARKMSDDMGEPMEPEFMEALNRIEAGEDPDTVMNQMDDTMGGPPGDTSDDADVD